MNGPIPIMFVMLSAVAWIRPKRRSIGDELVSGTRHGFMAGGVMRGALEVQKRVDGRDSARVPSPNANLGAPRTVHGLVGDRRAARRHHGGTGHPSGVHLEWLGKVPGAKRRRDVSHVSADRRDSHGVGGVVAIEHDATTIRQILKHVRGGVLVHPHDGLAAYLQRRERTVGARGRSAHTPGAPARAEGRRDGQSETQDAPVH